MRTEIHNGLIYSNDYESLNHVLLVISASKNKSELSENMRLMCQDLSSIRDTYIYGFGSSHMWLKERLNDSHNLITVYFE